MTHHHTSVPNLHILTEKKQDIQLNNVTYMYIYWSSLATIHKYMYM